MLFRHLRFVRQNALEHLFQTLVRRGASLDGGHLGHAAALVHKTHQLQHVLTLFLRMGVEKFRDPVKTGGFRPNRHGEVGVGTLAFQRNLLVQGLGNRFVQHVPKVPHARARRRTDGKG